MGIEVFAAVTEESPGTAMGLQEVQIKSVYEYTLLFGTERSHQVTAMVGNKRVAVKVLRGTQAMFDTGAIGGDDRNHV